MTSDDDALQATGFAQPNKESSETAAVHSAMLRKWKVGVSRQRR